MMESCLKTQVQLTEYAAGELTDRETRDVEQHILGCETCSLEYRNELRLAEALGSLPVRPLPFPVSGYTRPRTETREPGTSWPHRLWRTGLVAALAAVLVLMALPDGLFTPDDLEFAAGGGEWTEADLRSAERELEWTLALTARVIDRQEKLTVIDVFGKRLPAAVRESLRGALNNPQGGNG